MDYLLVLGFVILCLGVYLKISDPLKYRDIKENLLNWLKE
jgi:hypothetical protein|tara:strand:- start:607 stop:726 length:120 start_codon:yes stop_codon:yes gene_type:complete